MQVYQKIIQNFIFNIHVLKFFKKIMIFVFSKYIKFSFQKVQIIAKAQISLLTKTFLKLIYHFTKKIFLFCEQSKSIFYQPIIFHYLRIQRKKKSSTIFVNTKILLL